MTLMQLCIVPFISLNEMMPRKVVENFWSMIAEVAVQLGNH